MCILIVERLKELQAKGQNKNDKSNSDDTKPGQGDKTAPDIQEQTTHQGKLILDATVANQAIKYPNDLDLLNDAREFSELFIDVCWQGFGQSNKPRTYRRTARKEYLAVAKLKNKGFKVLYEAVGKQLNYLRRNLRFGAKPLGKPKKETPENREELKALKKQRHADYLDRIPVKGKFGQGKSRYRLNYIRAKLSVTATCWIGALSF